ncbi:MAG: hypothetical protein ABIJ27_00120, partial [Candidatus Omnitrophota bacterium]
CRLSPAGVGEEIDHAALSEPIASMSESVLGYAEIVHYLLVLIEKRWFAIVGVEATEVDQKKHGKFGDPAFATGVEEVIFEELVAFHTLPLSATFGGEIASSRLRRFSQ